MRGNPLIREVFGDVACSAQEISDFVLGLFSVDRRPLCSLFSINFVSMKIRKSFFSINLMFVVPQKGQTGGLVLLVHKWKSRYWQRRWASCAQSFFWWLTHPYLRLYFRVWFISSFQFLMSAMGIWANVSAAASTLLFTGTGSLSSQAGLSDPRCLLLQEIAMEELCLLGAFFLWVFEKSVWCTVVFEDSFHVLCEFGWPFVPAWAGRMAGLLSGSLKHLPKTQAALTTSLMSIGIRLACRRWVVYHFSRL